MNKYFLLILLLFPLLNFASPPPANAVFQLTTKQLDPNTFSIDWTIKKGFFLYKDRIKLKEAPDSNFRLGTLLFPKALKHTDARGKTTIIYRDHVTLPVAILGEQPGEAFLDIHYQGCSDDGFCYPPETRQVKLTINDELALTSIITENTADIAQPETHPPSESDKLAKLFAANNWGIIILSFFGFGLLLAFTPCVLPMVPVLSGIIVGHGKDLSTRKAFFLSLSYVLSMSVTYAAVGAIVALMGSNLQIAMQSPWIISLFSLIFVLLALSMFNFYELRLPIAWQAKLASVTHHHHDGHYLGAALMGCLSTLILSPCVTAPLIGALGYIAQTGDIALGSISLFFLGLGMGTPLLLIGTSAGKLLPKAGLWMNAVKSFFGIMLIAVAIYLMERVLPGPFTMVLWGSLVIFCGIYMGALTQAESNKDKFCQGLGIILLIYGLLILIGASQGKSNPLQPLATTTSVETQTESMVVVKTLADLQQALNNARGTPVMIDFYADWCASCKVIAQTTLKDKQVQSALKRFVVIKVDITANNTASKALLKHFDVVAPPTFIFLNAKGEELNTLRLVGELSADSLYVNLKQLSDTSGE